MNDMSWIKERLVGCDMISEPKGYGFKSALNRAVAAGVAERCVAPDGSPAWREKNDGKNTQ